MPHPTTLTNLTGVLQDRFKMKIKQHKTETQVNNYAH